MKKQLLFILTTTLALSLTCCKNDAKLFSGEYSYKTSGMVILKTDDEETSYKLTDKMGQLSVINLKSEKNDSVLLVLNEMQGDVVTIRAAVKDDKITLVPYTQTISVALAGEAQVTISGYGERYDDNIIIHEQYEGTLNNDEIDASLHSDNITLVAKRN